MSSGLYSITARPSGFILTAAAYNADHQNHVTNQNPLQTGAYSDDVTQMQASTDPGGLGSEVLATSLAGEIERLRFAIARILGGSAKWYEVPPTTLAGLAGFPVGSIIDYGGATAPTGWLFCYGQAISRTTYAALFTALGTTYGVGDGTTTFNVPDLRGRVVAGQDDMGGTSANRLTNQTGGLNGDTLGAAGGVETHVLTAAQLAAHTHAAGTLAAAAHRHFMFADATVSDGTPSITNANTMPKQDTAGFGFAAPGTATTATLGLTSLTTPAITGASASAGTDAAHNNVQPTIVLNKIVYTG